MEDLLVRCPSVRELSEMEDPQHGQEFNRMVRESKGLDNWGNQTSNTTKSKPVSDSNKEENENDNVH